MQPQLPVMIAMTALLGGCVLDNPEPEAPTPPAPIANDTCGANAYLPLIGQTSPVITVPANTPYRKYTTGDPVTMDFNMKRLNFEHDKSGKLVRVSCG